MNANAIPTVPATILDQIGGLRSLNMMLGNLRVLYSAKGVILRYASPTPSRGNVVHIELDSDLYNVRVDYIRGVKVRTVYEAQGVYADGLKAMIERQIGLYLSIR